MEQIGRYRITRELGRGAMGVVYEAQDPTIGRMIAIKSIRLSDLTDEAERARLRDRLFREAQSAGILSHPNIVTIYDIAEEGEMAYVFMEVVHGPSLDKFLGGASPPGREKIFEVLKQSAAALDYAHKKGIVHRDIKPANIMIDGDGTAKITDFGVAKIVSQQMTQAGILMGTPNYMSPEQVQTAEVTGRADQFSLAVLAYEFMTGSKPFTGDSLPSLLFKIVREEPPAPHSLNPTVGQAAELVLRKALAKNPAARYETCSAFVEALENASTAWVPPAQTQALQDAETLASTVSVSGATVPVPVLAEPAEPEPKTLKDLAVESPRRFRWVIAAGAVTLLFGTILLWPRHKSAPAEAPPVAAVTPQPDPKPSPAVQAKVPPPAPPLPVPVPVPVSDAPPPDAVPAAPPTASFHLTTNPPGAEAIFDSDEATRCMSPCTVDLPLGRHTVLMQRTGLRDSQRIFTLPDEPGLIVNLEAATGTLSLITNPDKLTVVIDGAVQSEKTPSSFTLPAGTHRVQVLRGTEKQEFAVEIRDGGVVQKTVIWN